MKTFQLTANKSKKVAIGNPLIAFDEITLPDGQDLQVSFYAQVLAMNFARGISCRLECVNCDGKGAATIESPGVGYIAVVPVGSTAANPNITKLTVFGTVTLNKVIDGAKVRLIFEPTNQTSPEFIIPAGAWLSVQETEIFGI